MTIIPIHLPISTAYLVRGERWVLVDTGAPGDAPRILQQMARHGIGPDEVALIFLTHGHVDHFGSAAALHAQTGAPVAVHEADGLYLREGRNPTMSGPVPEFQALCLEARLLWRLVPWSAPALQPDITFTETFDLVPYGLVDAQMLPTPGHSPGSVVLLLPDGALFAGDLLRGGELAGLIQRQRPNLPYFASDVPQLWASLEQVVALPFTTMYLGHGGPLTAEAVRQFYTTHAPRGPSASAAGQGQGQGQG